MNYIYQLLLCVLFIPLLGNAQSTTPLFNGENLEGWYAFEPTTGKHAEASELFHVEDHMIRLYGKKAGYLMSETAFQDFQLTVEFRWNTDHTFARKNNNKNSGIMYLIPTDAPDMIWPKGIQFQVKEGGTGDFIFLNHFTLDIKGKKIKAGKSVVFPRLKDATQPIGEWNTAVITSKNGTVTQKLNGKVVNKGKNPTATKGRILLQYEGYPIDFRKVEIKTYQ